MFSLKMGNDNILQYIFLMVAKFKWWKRYLNIVNKLDC